jgi:PadR family transcriptional regulator PadR
MKLRRSTQTVRLLSEFMQTPRDWKYGYDMGRNTGLKSGTLYPILIRLAELKLLETRWEASEAGKPPRHMYRLTAGGLRYARDQVSLVSKHRVGQPAFSGVKS